MDKESDVKEGLRRMSRQSRASGKDKFRYWSKKEKKSRKKDVKKKPQKRRKKRHKKRCEKKDPKRDVKEK